MLQGENWELLGAGVGVIHTLNVSLTLDLPPVTSRPALARTLPATLIAWHR